jgi:hypothetical protein
MEENCMSIKKISLIAVALVLLAAPLAGIRSAEAAPTEQDDLPSRSITVTGFGYAYGAPDVVRVGLGVEAANSDIMVAMNEVSTRMDAVIQVLTDAGVAPEDVRTDYFSVYQDYSFSGGAVPESGQPAPVYRVSTSVTVTVRSTENVGELLASSISAGANRVDYMQFDIADRSELEAEARDLAVADAQERAAQLAATLGLTVGEPLNVVENSNLYSPVSQFGGGGGGDMGSAVPPISQGQLSVSMAVTITFAVGQ